MERDGCWQSADTLEGNDKARVGWRRGKKEDVTRRVVCMHMTVGAVLYVGVERVYHNSLLVLKS